MTLTQAERYDSDDEDTSAEPQRGQHHAHLLRRGRGPEHFGYHSIPGGLFSMRAAEMAALSSVPKRAPQESSPQAAESGTAMGGAVIGVIFFFFITILFNSAACILAHFANTEIITMESQGRDVVHVKSTIQIQKEPQDTRPPVLLSQERKYYRIGVMKYRGASDEDDAMALWNSGEPVEKDFWDEHVVEEDASLSRIGDDEVDPSDRDEFDDDHESVTSSRQHTAASEIESPASLTDIGLLCEEDTATSVSSNEVSASLMLTETKKLRAAADSWMAKKSRLSGPFRGQLLIPVENFPEAFETASFMVQVAQAGYVVVLPGGLFVTLTFFLSLWSASAVGFSPERLSESFHKDDATTIEHTSMAAAVITHLGPLSLIVVDSYLSEQPFFIKHWLYYVLFFLKFSSFILCCLAFDIRAPCDCCGVGGCRAGAPLPPGCRFMTEAERREHDGNLLYGGVGGKNRRSFPHMCSYFTGFNEWTTPGIILMYAFSLAFVLAPLVLFCSWYFVFWRQKKYWTRIARCWELRRLAIFSNNKLDAVPQQANTEGEQQPTRTLALQPTARQPVASQSTATATTNVVEAQVTVAETSIKEEDREAPVFDPDHSQFPELTASRDGAQNYRVPNGSAAASAGDASTRGATGTGVQGARTRTSGAVVDRAAHKRTYRHVIEQDRIQPPPEHVEEGLQKGAFGTFLASFRCSFQVGLTNKEWLDAYVSSRLFPAEGQFLRARMLLFFAYNFIVLYSIVFVASERIRDHGWFVYLTHWMFFISSFYLLAALWCTYDAQQFVQERGIVWCR
ncbi:unnamed protein product [Amoebophrya sp. A25]|nr:unnamed protein product [Amoebophrya sp. A25]|eukprot:GSA25T00000067001.1